MSFIKKVFEKRVDDSVHGQFVRFGKGVYENRAAIKFIRGKEVKVNSSFEYANDFAELIAGFVEKMNISGVILSRGENREFGISKKKAGIYEYEINREVHSGEIKEILKKAYYILADIRTDEIEFKCKKKLPKPGKSREGKIDDKFCVLKADLKYWNRIREEFFPEFPENAKKGVAKHTFEIQKIITPPGEKDYEKVRLMSKRAGRIKRFLEIDKREEMHESEFEA